MLILLTSGKKTSTFEENVVGEIIKIEGVDSLLVDTEMGLVRLSTDRQHGDFTLEKGDSINIKCNGVFLKTAPAQPSGKYWFSKNNEK